MRAFEDGIAAGLPVGEDEDARLRALVSFGILDTEPTKTFDALVRAASDLCGVPMSMVSLVDADRQWFKAATGLNGVAGTPREYAFCGHTILNDEVFEVEDAQLDKRFATNPLVIGDPRIRFYAGAPIITRNGHRLGTICVIDTKARSLSDAQRATLRHLADVAMSLIEEESSQRDQLSAARLTLDSIADAVIAADVTGTVTYMNATAASLTGWSLEEAVGAPVDDVFVVDVSGQHPRLSPISECLSTGQPASQLPTTVMVSATTDRHVIDHSASPIITASGELVGGVLVFRDVTQASALQEVLEFQAIHDRLTGANNRGSFEAALAEAVDDAQGGESHHALLHLDLDQFKAVNDRLGTAVGDELLTLATSVARERLRANDMVARLGADEFGILLRNCEIDVAARVADDLTVAIRELRHSVGDRRSNIGASIGVVTIDSASASVHELLKAADQACYVAKQAGGSQVRLAEPDPTAIEKRSGRIRWLNAIHEALNEDAFVLHSQPIFELVDDGDQLRGIELLVRLAEDGSIHMPGRFMPVAESYRLAERIDRWVIAKALYFISRFESAFESVDSININLSAQSLENSRLAGELVKVVDQAGVDPTKLCFEVTESAAMMNPATAIDFITQVSSLGCTFALDDFGKGFSSFGYLKELPVHRVKIDGMFITDITANSANREMARSIAGISRTLGKTTVAECIETVDALETVRELGIDYGQGYHLGRPEPLTTFVERNAAD